MLNLMMKNFDVHSAALELRAERQKILASNIANADTPNFKARDFDFASAMAAATGKAGKASNTSSSQAIGMQATAAGHMVGFGQGTLSGGITTNSNASPAFRVADQASMDSNTVDMDRERANFLDNSLRYETTLRFMNSSIRQMLTAIKGE